MYTETASPVRREDTTYKIDTSEIVNHRSNLSSTEYTVSSGDGKESEVLNHAKVTIPGTCKDVREAVTKAKGIMNTTRATRTADIVDVHYEQSHVIHMPQVETEKYLKVLRDAVASTSERDPVMYRLAPVIDAIDNIPPSLTSALAAIILPDFNAEILNGRLEPAPEDRSECAVATTDLLGIMTVYTTDAKHIKALIKGDVARRMYDAAVQRHILDRLSGPSKLMCLKPLTGQGVLSMMDALEYETDQLPLFADIRKNIGTIVAGEGSAQTQAALKDMRKAFSGHTKVSVLVTQRQFTMGKHLPIELLSAVNVLHDPFHVRGTDELNRFVPSVATPFEALLMELSKGKYVFTGPTDSMLSLSITSSLYGGYWIGVTP